MQGQRNIFDPLPETVDLNQGPNFNSRGMNESDECNTMLSPAERRLLSNDLSGELNFSCVNMNDYSSRGFCSWDVGESSSRANVQNQDYNDGLKVERSWSSSFGTHDSRFKERQFESSNTQLRDSFSGSQVGLGVLNMQSSGFNRIPMNVDLNVGYGGNSGDDGGHGMGFMNRYKYGGPEMEASASSAGVGTSSECGTDSSFGTWGVSCKRKTLEGTSGQFFASGSSSCFSEAENIVWHTLPIHYNGSSSASVSSPTVNCQEQINARTGIGMKGGIIASDAFPPSSVPGAAESSQRHHGMRESVPFTILSTGNPERRSNNSSSHQSSRRITHSEYLDQTSRVPVSTSANSSHPSNQQPPSMHVPDVPRNVLRFPWSSNVNSRNGSSSSSALPRESGAEANFRSTLRNNEQRPYFVPSNEMSNLVQDPTNWSLATGRASTNGDDATSGSRNNSSCSHLSNAVGIPHLNLTTQSQQRLPEFPPWTLFPSSEAASESGGQRGHFPPFPSRFPSSEENAISSGVNNLGHHHQPFLRSVSMEVPSDEWHVFAADIEGGHRLISEMRQLLNAMRSGENLRAEDYMLFDPLINGLAELHDRHRDMRLDVDNMSYEELLALEERIGDVNTGLNDEVILKSMKQRKHISFMAISTRNSEPCCICCEEYDSGDDIGTLDCGHDFHTYCIKQWLAQKNLCPICKMTGLST